MAVLEAWAHGTPTIMSAACHLPEGFATGAALRCDTQASALATTLRTALHLPHSEWQAMATAARDLAAGPFSPAAIGRRWAEIYAGLLREAA